MPLTMLRVDTIHGRIPIETATSSHNMPQPRNLRNFRHVPLLSFIDLMVGTCEVWSGPGVSSRLRHRTLRCSCTANYGGSEFGEGGGWAAELEPDFWNHVETCRDARDLAIDAQLWGAGRRAGTPQIAFHSMHGATDTEQFADANWQNRFWDIVIILTDFERFWEIWQFLTTDLTGLPGDLTWCSSRQSSVTGVPGVPGEPLWIGQFLSPIVGRSTSLVVDFVAGSAAALMQFIAVQWQWHNDDIMTLNFIIKWGPRYTAVCELFERRTWFCDRLYWLDTSWHWRCQGVAKSGRTWLDTRMHTGM